MVLKRVGIRPEQVLIYTEEPDRAVAEAAVAKYGVRAVFGTLLLETLGAQLDELNLEPGDFMLNVTCDVDTNDLIRWCHGARVLYVDTTTEVWLSCPPALRSTYAMREAQLKLKREYGPCAVTALTSHGANPGIVSHFVKRALLALEPGCAKPTSKAAWAALARRLGVKLIQVSEFDWQQQHVARAKDDFVCTWSAEAMIAEASQHSELGWGSHEKRLPQRGFEHAQGTRCGIEWAVPGAEARVRTWSPLHGSFLGFCGSHAESFSIADYFTVHGDDDGTAAVYRPTVHFAYKPCDQTLLGLHELMGRGYDDAGLKRTVSTAHDIASGGDELGVLLGGNRADGTPFCFWYGSQLVSSDATARAEGLSATTLQVCAGAIAAVLWVLKHPNQGVLEADEIDHCEILETVDPYVAPMVGVFSDWTPVQGRGDDVPDAKDVWQFSNVVFGDAGPPVVSPPAAAVVPPDAAARFVVDSAVPPGIKVGQGKWGRCLIATKAFVAGELMYKGHCVLATGVEDFALRLTHADGTVETCECSTVNSVMDSESSDGMRQFYGFDGYMDHSCDPNCYCPATSETADRKFYDAFAIRDIREGEEICCDYATFDYECDGHEIAVCGCGATSCRGSMRGFKQLSLHEQVRVLHLCDAPIVTLFHAAHPCAKFVHSEFPAGVALEGAMGSTSGENTRAAALVATRDFSQGEAVFTNTTEILTYAQLEACEGCVVLRIDGQHCLVDKDEHMIHRAAGYVEVLGFDIFMDHSCDPTTHQTYSGPTEYTVFAARPVKQGEKLTCDYNQLHNQSAGDAASVATAAFDCKCGAPTCRGYISY